MSIDAKGRAKKLRGATENCRKQPLDFIEERTRGKKALDLVEIRHQPLTMKMMDELLLR